MRSTLLLACVAAGLAAPLESLTSVHEAFSMLPQQPAAGTAPASLLEWDSGSVGISSSYRSEYINYEDQGEVKKTLGCNKPSCLIPAKVEGPLPTRLSPRADRSYKTRPFLIQREDGKEWTDRESGDNSVMHFKQEETATSLLEYANYFEPEEIPSSYRGEYISYNDLGEKKTTLGCNKPSCLIAAKVEGPLPTRLSPRADRSYKTRPFLIQREDGKEWSKRESGDNSVMN